MRMNEIRAELKSIFTEFLILMIGSLALSCQSNSNSHPTEIRTDSAEQYLAPKETSQKPIDSSGCISISKEEYSTCYGEYLVCPDDKSFKGMALRQRINNNLNDSSRRIPVGCGPVIDTLSLTPECYLVNLWYGASGAECWIYQINKDDKFAGRKYGYHGKKSQVKTDGFHDFVLRSYHDMSKEGTHMAFAGERFDTVSIHGIPIKEYTQSKLTKCTSCLGFKKVEKTFLGFEHLKFAFLTDALSSHLEYDYSNNMLEVYEPSEKSFWCAFLKNSESKDTSYKFIGFFRQFRSSISYQK